MLFPVPGDPVTYRLGNKVIRRGDRGDGALSKRWRTLSFALRQASQHIRRDKLRAQQALDAVGNVSLFHRTARYLPRGALLGRRHRLYRRQMGDYPIEEERLQVSRLPPSRPISDVKTIAAAQTISARTEHIRLQRIRPQEPLDDIFCQRQRQSQQT